MPDARDLLHRYATLGAGLDLIDQGLSVFDADLRLVAWNRPFERLLGFPPGLVRVGAPFADFIGHNARRGEYGPGDAQALVDARVAQARRFEAHAFERTRPDGRILRIVGEPLPGGGFITLYSDVTVPRRDEATIRRHAQELERRVAERTAELARSEQQMRLITDSIPALVAYVDHRRVYRYANRGYAEWFGLDPARPEQISARNFLGPATFEGIRGHVSRAFAGEAAAFEYDITRIDGSVVRARTSLIPDRTADGGVAGCFELTFDISAQQRAQELMARAQRLEALGQLTGGLAHECNNLLTVVIGNLQALHERRGDAAAEFVAPALLAARRGVELTRGLLGFARRQPLQSAPVEAGAALDAALRLVRPSLPRGLALEAEVAGGAPLWLRADPHQLEAALLNLVFNARDACGQAGRIVLHAAAAALDAEAAAPLQLAPGGYVRIDVRDDGAGMDASTRARVFEPFFTTKPTGAGTGLGLSIVYGFARQSGGAADIASRPGAGTTVSLWLPRTGAPAPVPAAPRGLALLVDDAAAVRRVVRRGLVGLGFAVVEAASGDEARALLAHLPAVALLLTDVAMPGATDGYALARHALGNAPAPRVLLVSAFAPAAPPPEGCALLTKPFTAAQLAAALE
ncbi:hybrid sensor histidine kinase/response regulator [Xylophilus sp.]|uniref:hybrid sensor histidine kinase/response regulator n=1 Tax=Xylophilus sp. TaxID=2653893 RepID=UPI0013BD4963|nr:PAS-domain containing protein [Xylophilus sp.]KAF1043895.1 MAG: Blue-light-activated protein [Xylophilus sp.]